MEGSEMILVHPNREKPAAKATKAAIVLLLIASAVLVLVVTIGGWAATSSIKLTALFMVALYLLMAFFVVRWNRGMLAMSAGVAILFTIVALVSVPAWFARDKAGFDDPLLPAGLLGLLTLILVPVQVLLVAFSVRGFNQAWNVEVEVTRDEAEEGVGEKFDEEGKRIDAEHGGGGDDDRYEEDDDGDHEGHAAADRERADAGREDRDADRGEDHEATSADRGGGDPSPARNPHLGRGPARGPAGTAGGGPEEGHRTDADLADESRSPGEGDEPRS